MITKLPHLFSPRPYQQEKLTKFFIEGVKNQLWVDHRRSGKDLTALTILTAEAILERGIYLYLFPESTQLRKVIWRGIDADGIPFLDRIPKALIDGKPNNTELFVKLINGSKIQFSGTDNPHSLRGMGARGIIWSEFQNHNPIAFEIMSPMIVQTKGWQIIQGTPLGKNHFYHMYQSLQENQEWFIKKLTVEDTKNWNGSPVITQAQIDNERAKGISEESIRQEYYCDFNIGAPGSYYTHQIDKAEKENRITNFEINRALPIFTTWDIGVSDPTSIWFFQPRSDGMIDFIYCLEETDKGIEYFVKRLYEIKAELKITASYAGHIMPHDVAQRKFMATPRSSLSILHDYKIHPFVCPNVGIDNGVQAVRAIFDKCRFHKTNCTIGIDALREYRREWDDENKTFRSKPLHNWASHLSDSFRYFAVYWRDAMIRDNKPRTYVNEILESY